jgi:hypothetical protein
VDAGTLRGDLVELAAQMLEIYAGDTSRAALRLILEADGIPGVAEHYEARPTPSGRPLPRGRPFARARSGTRPE